MGEIFGILPLVKLFFIALLLMFSSLLIGNLFSRSSKKDQSVPFVLGLLVIVSCYAIYHTLGTTIFTPTLLSILLIFKVKVKDWKQALTRSLSPLIYLFVFFSFFFIEELFKQYYFSQDIVQSAYTDFSYYIEAVESIINSGIESSMSYMNFYGYDSGKSIYHYFDLYLLMPALGFNVSSHISYLFFLVPFSYAIGAFLLSQLIGDHLPKWVKITAMIIVFHLAGIDLLRFKAVSSVSFFAFHKAIYLLIPLAFLKQWFITKSMKYLMASLLLSVCINPILSILVGLYIVPILIKGLRHSKLKLKDFFTVKYCIVYCGFIVYAYVFFIKTENTGNRFLYPEFDVTLSAYLMGVFKRFTTYLIGLRNFPSFVIAMGAVVLIYWKEKRINQELKTTLTIFLIAHLIGCVLFFHSESFQFFSITVVVAVSLMSYYGVLLIWREGYKYIGALILAILLAANILNGFHTYLKPHIDAPVSAAYVEKVANEIGKYKGKRKILYFENPDKKWRRLMPHLPFGIGYTNLFENTHVLQATLTSVVTNLNTFNTTGLKSIEISPFQQFCIEKGYEPKSYDDVLFKKAVYEFIQYQNISLLIFNEDMEIPSWVEEFGIRSRVNPVTELDHHTFIFL